MNEIVWISTETSLEKAYSRLKRFDADFDELRGYLSGYALSRSTRQGGNFIYGADVLGLIHLYHPHFHYLSRWLLKYMMVSLSSSHW